MEKQTAVEWLAIYLKGITSLNCDEVIEQAKEMEKQQIKDAYKFGISDEYVIGSEKYYNKTYNS
jgi:hypothetical protein